MHSGSAEAVEHVDVVVVGARCSGCAAAIALAREGRRVLALDGASFPSDTLSTHLFWPSTWAEVRRLGALERVQRLGAPEHTTAGVHGAGIDVVGPYGEVDGIGYGASVRRTGLDMALVQTARDAGVEVRERTRVTEVVFDSAGRATGVRWRERDGLEGVIHAQLVIGADGRNSTVARLVGAPEHHHFDNRRMMAYAYYSDPRSEQRHTAMQWRVGTQLATVFPCDGDLSLILLMPPVDHADDYKSDPIATFERSVEKIPQLTERLRGCERQTKVRMSFKHPSYFRHSSGPGWALTGDAGHFKDPVTAQGIRDALRFGRLLGEAVAPVVDQGAAALDRAVAAWETDRDAQCLPMYQWANGLGAADEVSPIEAAAYGWLADQPDGATQLLDVFSRSRTPQSLFTPRNLATWTAGALRSPRHSAREVMGTLRRDVRREAARLTEQVAFTRRRAASRRAFDRGRRPASATPVRERRVHVE